MNTTHRNDAAARCSNCRLHADDQLGECTGRSTGSIRHAYEADAPSDRPTTGIVRSLIHLGERSFVAERIADDEIVVLDGHAGWDIFELDDSAEVELVGFVASDDIGFYPHLPNGASGETCLSLRAAVEALVRA